MTATTVPAAVAPDASVSNRLPRGAALSDALVIAGRNVKHLLRTPQLLVASVAQTVMFLLLFRYVFGGSIQIPDMTFVDYLIPGYLATIAIFDGFGVSIFFAEDSKSGLIERFRALPMARSAVVGGRAIADLLRQAALLAITTLVGVAVGFGFARELRRHRPRVRHRAGVGLCAVLGVRRHRALRPRRRDRASRVDTVLHPGVRVVGDHRRQHAARVAATVRRATSRCRRCATRCAG